MSNNQVFQLEKLGTEELINKLKSLYTIATDGGTVDANTSFSDFMMAITKPISSDMTSMLFADSSDLKTSIEKFFNEIFDNTENRKNFIELVCGFPTIEERLKMLMTMLNAYSTFTEDNDDLDVRPSGNCTYLPIIRKDELVTKQVLISLFNFAKENNMEEGTLGSVISTLDANRLTDEAKEDPNFSSIFLDDDIYDLDGSEPEGFREWVANRTYHVPFIVNGINISMDATYDIGMLHNVNLKDVSKTLDLFNVSDYQAENEQKFTVMMNVNPKLFLDPRNIDIITPGCFPLYAALKAATEQRVKNGCLPSDYDIEGSVEEFWNDLADVLVTPENIKSGVFDEARYLNAQIAFQNVPIAIFYHNYLRYFRHAIMRNADLLPNMVKVLQAKYQGNTTLMEAFDNRVLFSENSEVEKLIAFVKKELENINFPINGDNI